MEMKVPQNPLSSASRRLQSYNLCNLLEDPNGLESEEGQLFYLSLLHFSSIIFTVLWSYPDLAFSLYSSYKVVNIGSHVRLIHPV